MFLPRSKGGGYRRSGLPFTFGVPVGALLGHRIRAGRQDVRRVKQICPTLARCRFKHCSLALITRLCRSELALSERERHHRANKRERRRRHVHRLLFTQFERKRPRWLRRSCVPANGPLKVFRRTVRGDLDSYSPPSWSNVFSFSVFPIFFFLAPLVSV